VKRLEKDGCHALLWLFGAFGLGVRTLEYRIQVVDAEVLKHGYSECTVE